MLHRPGHPLHTKTHDQLSHAFAAARVDLSRPYHRIWVLQGIGDRPWRCWSVSATRKIGRTLEARCTTNTKPLRGRPRETIVHTGETYSEHSIFSAVTDDSWSYLRQWPCKHTWHRLRGRPRRWRAPENWHVIAGPLRSGWSATRTSSRSGTLTARRRTRGRPRTLVSSTLRGA